MSLLKFYNSARSGAALLLCLTIILIISATTTIALQQFRSAHLGHHAFQEQQTAMRLIKDQINWSLRYFEHHHESLSLVANEQIPLIVLRDDHILSQGRHYHIHVQAFDAHAGIPVNLLKQKNQYSQAIQQLLPQEFRLVSLQNLSIDNPLTDQATIWLDARLNNEDLRFPKIGLSDVTTTWYDKQADQESLILDQVFDNESEAAWVTWINSFGKAEININTCPEQVLTWAMTEKQLEQNIDDVLAARAEGNYMKVPKNTRTSNATRQRQNKSFKLIDTSTRWILDIRISGFQQTERALAVIDCAKDGGLIQLIEINN